jgi:putative hydrolase of HD superfamily
MITAAFIRKIFDAASMIRWNDKMRPIEFTELNKQAHKMIIAYVLGKFEEENSSSGLDWIEIIEGGIFELLQRIVVTDLKPQLFHRIERDPDRYKELNLWVYKELEDLISPINNNFCKRFKNYLLEEDIEKNLNKRILRAAHYYASRWEFNIIESANPNGYAVSEIKRDLQEELEKYGDLKGIHKLAMYSNYKSFVNLCGELTFQIRWSHLHRVPRTSVLGHMLIVAILSYLISIEIGACRKRRINNYFTGLFHDLPEVLTKDIKSPVKKAVKELDRLIKEYEIEEMQEKIYTLIPASWHSEMKMFTEDEFISIVTVKGRIETKSSDEITKGFNEDGYNPRDGEIVGAVDDLSAFIEVCLALENGIGSMELRKAKDALRTSNEEKSISGFSFKEIYGNFP